ncbi:MAG: SdrD B-like domain-containing protein [Patescibacteria group bacterium]
MSKSSLAIKNKLFAVISAITLITTIGNPAIAITYAATEVENTAIEFRQPVDVATLPEERSETNDSAITILEPGTGVAVLLDTQVEASSKITADVAAISTPERTDDIVSREICTRDAQICQNNTATDNAATGGIAVSDIERTHGAPVGGGMSVSPNIQGGSIAGTIIEDMDGDGTRDEEEPGITGWTVELYTSPITTNAPLKTTDSDESGNYLFDTLEAGTYVVKVLVHEAWTQTFPQITPATPEPQPAMSVLGTEENALQSILEDTFISTSIEQIEITASVERRNGSVYVVTLGENEHITDKNFGAFADASLSGAVWYDLNADGVWQTDGEYPESPISGWNVIAYYGDTEVNKLTENGRYSFSFNPFKLGTWVFDLIVPSEGAINDTSTLWKQISPTNPDTFSETITTSGSTLTDRNFGVIKLYDVLGIKMAPFSGVSTTTYASFVPDASTIMFPMGTSFGLVGIPAFTRFDRTNGENFNMMDIAVSEVLSSALSNIPQDMAPKSAARFGLSADELTTNTELLISLPISDTTLEGTTLKILRAMNEAGPWGPESIDSCTVVSGNCVFGSSKTGLFVTVVDNSTPPSGGNGGSGGSSGGGGGGGGGGSSGGNVPPPTGNNGDGSGTGTGTGTEINTADNAFGVGGNQFDLIPVRSVLAQSSDDSSGTGGGADDENEGILAGISEENEGQERIADGFLGRLSSLFTLGTGSLLFGWIVWLIILATLFLLFFRRTENQV